MFGRIITEFTKNYKSIFQGHLNPATFSIFGYKLGDSVQSIDFSMILETTFHVYPEGITQSSYKNGKVFYEIDGKTIEFLLTDRIDSVVNSGGWFQMKDGYSIRITDQIIVEFMLGKILPDKIRKLSKSKIIEKFGDPSNVKEVYEDIDGSLFATDYTYSKLQIRISYDDWDKEISNINIGEPLIVK